MTAPRLTHCIRLITGICAFVLLIGCSEPQPTEDTQQASNTADTGFVFSDFTARQFSKDGQLTHVLSGESLSHHPKQKRYVIKMAKGLTPKQSKNTNEIAWQIKADRAQANDVLSQIIWQDNVRITDAHLDSQTIRTETITQLPNDGIISGNKPVTFESNLGTMKGQSFTLNTKTEALNLSGDVSGRYHNEQ